jgi:Family of unknown function (DUF6445)
MVLDQTYQASGRNVEIWRHGTERQAVAVIDNYLPQPEKFIEAAAVGCPFEPMGPYYPGIRALCPDALLPDLLDPLEEVFKHSFGFQTKPSLQECTFSLVTTKPTDLMPIQRLPHFDSLEEGRVAVLLFLGRSHDNGGTAFYRQRSTGFESLNAARYKEFGTALSKEVGHFGMPEQDYVADDNPMYETLAVHEGRFNRMLVYKSATLHSGRIPKGFAFSADPRLGRLTVNAFLGRAT